MYWFPRHSAHTVTKFMDIVQIFEKAVSWRRGWWWRWTITPFGLPADTNWVGLIANWRFEVGSSGWLAAAE